MHETYLTAIEKFKHAKASHSVANFKDIFGVGQYDIDGHIQIETHYVDFNEGLIRFDSKSDADEYIELELAAHENDEVNLGLGLIWQGPGYYYAICNYTVYDYVEHNKELHKMYGKTSIIDYINLVSKCLDLEIESRKQLKFPGAIGIKENINEN